MKRSAFRDIALPAAFAVLATAVPAVAQPPARQDQVYQAPAVQRPAYQIVSNDPNGLEIRFRGVNFRDVHADDSQNALAIVFQLPVDGALFEHLPAEAPQWIAMSYCNFDNGIIRTTRPVTFLTRPESDGFSLRIVPRGPASMPPAPMPQRPIAPGTSAPSLVAPGPGAQAAPRPPAPPPPSIRGGYTERQIWPALGMRPSAVG
jgi:hypothetical protein